MALLAAAWALALPLPAQDFVVHVGAGEAQALERAQAAVRAVLAATRSGDVTVRLSGGVHRLAAPLVFQAADAGGDDRTVRWEAAPGERVVISGGRALPDWRVEADGTWSRAAPAADPLQLFVDGERRPRARTPDEGWLRVEAPGPDGRTSFAYPAGALAAWDDAAGGEVVFLHDWSMSRTRIGRVDEAAGTVHFADRIGGRLPFFHITGFEAHPRFRVENVRAALDAAGEWRFDRRARRLVYSPWPGERPGETPIVTPLLDRLLVIDGRPEEPVRGLHFVDLTFAHTRAPDPPRGFAGVQASFYEVRPPTGEPTTDTAPPGAVHARFAQELLFEGCRFEHLGGTGLWLGAGCRDGRVRACTFSDVGANGVMIGEPQERAALTSRVEFSDNLVERCGALDHGAVGVWIGIATGVRVHHNEVRSLPYTGISLGWIWDPRPSPSRGHRIEHNHIHHVMQLLSDGAGIYTLGRQPDTVIASNLIHDVPVNLGRAGSNGIFVDQGSCELTFEDNVIHSIARSPIRFHLAGDSLLRRNVLVAAEGVPVFAYHACSAEGKVFEDNVSPDAHGWTPPGRAELGVGPRR